MTENYKILAKFIKDLSSETPNTETYLFVKDNIAKYQLGIDITSKALKNQMVEINTKLKFEDKEENAKKSYFEIIYATIIRVNDKIKEKKELDSVRKFLIVLYIIISILTYIHIFININSL